MTFGLAGFWALADGTAARVTSTRLVSHRMRVLSCLPPDADATEYRRQFDFVGVPALAPCSTRNVTTVWYFSALGVERRAAVVSRGMHLSIPSELNRDLHGRERQRFALAARRLDPGRSASHSRRCHQGRRRLPASLGPFPSVW